MPVKKIETENWNELDSAARVNLNDNDLVEFTRYKEWLKVNGNTWNDAYEMLSGFIWDKIEVSGKM